jgi:hypothetical protein
MFRFRFRLITLFAVMSLVAIAAAAYSMYDRSLHAEERALTRIAAKGALMYMYDGQEAGTLYFPDPVAPPRGFCGTGLLAHYGPSGSPQDFTDADLRLFDHVHTKLRISFQRTSVTPAALQKFKKRHPEFQIIS